MRHSLIALAALCATCAHAQSSVTLFGVVDATIARGSGSIASRTQMLNSGTTASRLGFRGQEDLGGGSYAAFWLEAGVNNDDGSGVATNPNNQAGAATTSSGLTFNRKSTVSLGGTWGELRLGRDYTPQFLNLPGFDPFGAVGVGTTQVFRSIITGFTSARASNSVSYFLPRNLGGFHGQFMYYMGENASNAGTPAGSAKKDGNGAALRVGYANGPLEAALALSRTNYVAGNVKQNNLAGSYNFDVVKVTGHYEWDSSGRVDAKGSLLGVIVPVGSGELKATLSRYKTDAAGSPSSRKWAVGYVHNLSKRTAVYTTLAQVSNKGGASQALNGATTAANGSSRGFDLGLRHSF